MKNALPKPMNLVAADSFRDGGSHSITFEDNAGRQCRLFLKVIVEITKEKFEVIGFHKPVLKIYGDFDFGYLFSNEPITTDFDYKETERELTWEEGKKLSEELEILVKSEGFPPNELGDSQRMFQDAKMTFQIIRLKGEVPSDLRM